jgi:hypothetical protein
VLLGGLVLPARGLRADEPFKIPRATAEELEKSPLVYVSPLRADGAESRCHGEVWYFVDAGDVVIATGPERWKARALKLGRERARLWVGDFGRASGADGPFRKGPTFTARASLEAEAATFERLLKAFGAKYPDEWAKWEPRFRKERAEGKRVLIRYSPVAA